MFETARLHFLSDVFVALSFLGCRLDRLAEAFSLCEGCSLAGPQLSSPVLFPRPLVKSLLEAKLVSIYKEAYQAETAG